MCRGITSRWMGRLDSIFIYIYILKHRQHTHTHSQRQTDRQTETDRETETERDRQRYRRLTIFQSVYGSDTVSGARILVGNVLTGLRAPCLVAVQTVSVYPDSSLHIVVVVLSFPLCFHMCYIMLQL